MHRKTTLENGLRLVTASMPHIRSLSVNFFIGTGSRYETDAQGGISHFIEHLLFKGTEKRPTSAEICTAIEGTGGLINAGTDKELTIYYCKVARPHFDLALDVIADMLLNARFEPAEIEKERQVIIEEINMCYDSPAQRVGMLIDELLWTEHPLGRDIAGTRESVSGISRDTILDYLSRHYLPANTTVAVAGDISHEEVLSAVREVTGKWRRPGNHPSYQNFSPAPGKRVKIENRETEQAQVCLGLPGLSMTHPDRFILDLLNVILGEGMSSRLFTEIRDKMGLAYSIHSFAEHFLDTGSLTIAAGVEPGNLRVALGAILAELGRLKEEVPAAEISKAKEFTKGRLMLRMEDSRAVASWLGGQEILTGQILTVDEVIAFIDAITAEDLRRVAADLLRSEQLKLAVVGPVPADEPLEELLHL
ncbi:MAG: pitrilysin family protein [Chloroflexota bacterium]